MITVISSRSMGSKLINGQRYNRALVVLAGLSTDAKPIGEFGGVVIGNGSVYQEIDTGAEYAYDEAGRAWHVNAGTGSGSGSSGSGSAAASGRITSLDGTPLVSEQVVEAVGIPVYVSSPEEYELYSLAETGWYVFARVMAPSGCTVTSQTTVDGAAGCVKAVGADHIDVAVRFDVAAESRTVTIDWGATADSIVFKATDLAVRNLDYRTTYYVYDISDNVTWHYKRSADPTFVGTEYYTESDGVYTRAAVKSLQPIPADTYYQRFYVVTTDTEFVDGKKYYTLNGTAYVEAEVTPGDPVVPEESETPPPTYYVDDYRLTADTYFSGNAYYVMQDGEYVQIATMSGEPCSYYIRVVTYPLPGHANFAGTEYWIQDNSELGYSRVAVKAGEEMAVGTYYTHAYTLLTAAGKFQADTRYYKKVGTDYELQTVTVGASYAKNTYYVDQWTLAEGSFVGTAYYLDQGGEYTQVAVKAGEAIPAAYYTKIVSYIPTEDETILAGKTYYAEENGEYVVAEVAVGDEITGYYYEQVITYTLATGIFEDGIEYYTAPAGVYTPAEVTVGEAIPDLEYCVQLISWPQYTAEEFGPDTYYTRIGGVYEEATGVAAGDVVPVWFAHDKVTFAGFVRNITYKFDEMIDAPIEIILPEIPDDGHGAWFEIQLRYKTTYSATVVPPTDDVKMSSSATATQSQGINVIDMHYSCVGGAKVWRMINTHSNFVGQ